MSPEEEFLRTTDLEHWGPVESVPGLWASNLGKLLRESPDGLLKVSTHNHGHGYRAISVRTEKGHKPRLVHTLVLEAFEGQRPEGKPVTRHLNSQPSDNRWQNLAYGTQSENMRDCVEAGRHQYAGATHCIHGHEFTEENTYRYLTIKETPARKCKACTKETNRKRYLNQKVSA